MINVPQEVDNSTKDKDKLAVRMTLRNPNATGKDITKSLCDYFKKYHYQNIKVPEPIVLDALEIFDGGLF